MTRKTSKPPSGGTSTMRMGTSLLAGLYASGETCVTEPAPTRDHTERMLKGFGYALNRDGDRVCLHQTAANRDPAVFERPDAVDPERAQLGHHLAFGHGTHYCLGAPLARLEAALAFDRLVRSYPDLQVSDGQLEWRRTMLARNLARLPVSFGSRAAA